MDIYELLNKRISVRKYSDTYVEKNIVEKIMRGVIISPSACNLQPWRFIVISNDVLKKKLLPNWSWATEAPYMVVACGIHEKAWKRPFDGKDHTDIDIAIAMENLILLATEEGLGTCWICCFDEKIVSEALNLPEGMEPIALTPLGYPEENDDWVRNRKDFTEIVEWRD